MQQIAVSIFVEECKAFDLTPVQYAALVAIHTHPGIDATRLSAVIAFDRSTLGNVIERLENKIRTISEMAVNRQEPEFISGQVDEVAGSMVQTERTMSELDFLTGLGTADEAVPPMMQRETVVTKR